LCNEPLLQQRTPPPAGRIGGPCHSRGQKTYGYISEHHAFGRTEKETGDYAEDLAAAMLASTLGIDFDIDESWDEKKKYSKSAARLSARGISRNQPLLKTTGSRRSWPPRSLFSRPAAA